MLTLSTSTFTLRGSSTPGDSPPDFDIDYSWKERDEVIDYIFRRYGYEDTALLGTISTFRESR